MKTKISTNTIVLLISCLISLVLLEGLLRLYNPVEQRLRGDKIVLPVNRNYDYRNETIPGLDELIIHRKNSLGFRGEEAPKDFTKYLTIITVGGSTTECTFISDRKTWPDLLADKLRNYFHYLWLNNAGLGGHSTFGHIVLMMDYLVKIKPKVILFLVGINDVECDDANDYDVENIGKLSFNSIQGLYKSLTAHSELLSLWLNFYRYFKAKIRGLSSDEKINLTAMKEIDLTDSYCEKIKTVHKNKYLAGYEFRLRKLVQITKQNGIEPVLITQPMLWGYTIDDITNINLGKVRVMSGTSGKHEWEILELYNDITRMVGQKENILVIDLAKKMPKSSLYFYDDVHYSNKGAEKVSEIIYEDLLPFLTAICKKWNLNR